MSGLPEGWEIEKIGDVLHVARGGSPRPIKSFLTDAPNGLNWIKISDATSGGALIKSTKQKIRPEGLAKTRKISPGDFLLSNSMSFGRPYISEIEGCIHDGWLVLSDEAKIYHKEFLYYCLLSRPVQLQFEAKASGTTVRNLNSDLVREVEIPLPPLAEQERIVAKLDRLSARSGKAKTHLAEVQTLATRAKQATLAAAFRGELTADLENGQMIELVESLPAEYAGSAFPETWAISTVGEFAENHDSRRVPIKRADRANRQGAFPYYGASGIIDTFDDFIFEGRYLLVAEDGANLLSRSTAIAFTADGQFWVNNHAHILKVEDEHDHDFLRLYLESIALDPFVTGSAQPKLTQRALSNIGVLLPPKQIRVEIVRRIKAAFARIDRVAQEASRAADLLDRLDQELLVKAFRGELVPQDPTDEPASALLARIREARANASKPKRRRKTAKT